MKEEDDVNRGGARGYKKMRGGGSVFSPYEFYRIKRWFYADLVVAPQKCTPWLKGPTPPQEFVGRRIGRRWDAARDVILRKFWLPGWQPFLMIVFVKVWYHIFQGLFWCLTLPWRHVIWGIFLSSTWIFKQSTKRCYCLVDATYFVKQRPLWPHGKNDKITTCQNKWQFCYLLVDNKSIKVFREQSSIARNYRLDSISGKLPKTFFY